MYPGELHKIPTETIDSSQVFERLILQKQPKIINKITKAGTKTHLKIWNSFVPNSTTIVSLDFCPQRQYYLEFFYIPDHSTVLYARFVIIES